MAACITLGASQAAAQALRGAAARANAAKNFARLPLSFEENRGQADAQVKFLSRTPGYTLILTGREAIFAFPAQRSKANRRAGSGSALRLRFDHTDADAQVTGEDELPGKANYFLHAERSRWHTKIPNYARVRYQAIYPGVNAVFHGNPQRLEFDFEIAPGADPAKIALDFAGGRVLRLADDGDVVLSVNGSSRSGKITLGRPIVYQQIAGVRRKVSGRFVVRSAHRIGFELGAYDRTQPLVIDPTLSYSTFLGGVIGNPSYAYGDAIAVDSSGSAYVSGFTGSFEFPTPSGLEETIPGGTYVSKFSPDGSQLEYTAFLAGCENGNAIALDSSGSVYVSETADTSFTTPGAYQNGAGANSITVAKLSPDGSELVYAAQIGSLGSYPFAPQTGIAVDSQGSAYVVGYTLSPSFPTTPGAWLTTPPGCQSGVCAAAATVTKLSPDGSSLVYSTLLAGHGGTAGSSVGEFGYSIAVDAQGDAYVAGTTQSTDFPVTPGAPQPTCLGWATSNDPPFCESPNAFLTELNPAGSGIIYSTFLGTDVAGGGLTGQSTTSVIVSLDSSGNAYLTGSSVAASFTSALAAGPVVSGPSLLCPNSTGNACNEDFAFVAKFPPGGTQLAYLGFLGGNSPPGAQYGQPATETYGIAADSSGNAYVTGFTSSTYFPVASNAYQDNLCADPSLGCVDAFFTILDTNVAGIASLTYSTYLGSNAGVSQGSAIAVDADDNAYLTGMTEASDFPSTPGAFQPACSASGTASSPDCENAFLVKFSSGITPAASSIAAVSGGGQSAVIGQPFTNPLVVKVTDSENNPVSGATVAFSAPSSGASAALSSTTATTNSSGNASVTATANGTAGSAYTVSATVAGAAAPAAFALTNTQAATTVSITLSATSLPYGEPLGLAAAIGPSSVGATVPTGDVAFYDGSTTLTQSAAVSNGVAKYAVSVPAVGAHSYAAQYLGNTNFLPSARTSAPSTVTVNKATPTLSVTSAQPVRVQSGASTSIALALSVAYAGNGIAQPTGGLNYTVSGNAFGPGSLTLTGGNAALPVPAKLAVGSYTITVTYPGDENYRSVSIQIPLVVYSPLVITPAALPNAITGQPYSQTLSASGGSGAGYTWSITAGASTLTDHGLNLSSAGLISGTPSSAGLALFIVQVTDSQGDTATTLCQIEIQNPVSVTATVNDQETITVNDSGTQVQLIDVADAETITVTGLFDISLSKPATTTGFSITPSPASYGQPVTFGAAVTAANGATPTGTVTFACPNGPSGQSVSSGPVDLVNGAAAWTTTTIAAGQYNNCFTASYAGTSAFDASVSIAESLTVTNFQITFAAPHNLTLIPGQSVTLNFTLAPENGAYNGTVDFAMTGLPPGVTATFNPTTATLGSNSVVVVVTLTAESLAASRQPHSRGAAPLFLALVLPFPFVAPFVVFSRARRSPRRARRIALLAILASLAIAGAGSCSSVRSGFFNQPPQTSTVTLTATSGTAKQSTSFSLTVE